MIPRILTTLVVAALVPLAVSCADDADATSHSPSSVAAATPATSASTVEAAPESAPATTVDDPSGGVPPNGEIVEVLALDNSFRPDTIEISAGTAVRWENRGRNDHNILPSDDSAEFGVEVEGFAPGDEYEFVFDTPGEYPYYCSLHGTATVGMVGTIVVTD